MSSPLLLLSLLCLSLSSHFLLVLSCGITTHTEIAHRAMGFFEDDNFPIYERLIKKHQSAFQAGNPYPDAMYNSLCFGGDYHDIAEDTHWTPFMNATARYIRETYPKPWDEATEKLVAFFLGFVAHQVSDVTWHSLGIDQGFLSTMGDIDFHGSFSDAHSVGDAGGDVISQFSFNMDYIRTVVEWYVPIEDLYNVYLEYYGRERINQTVIEHCTAWLFLGRLGEQLALAETYKHFASESPFMIDSFSEYFLGGLDDMSIWTSYIWHDSIDMIEYGPETCNLDNNPIYVYCNEELLKCNTTLEGTKKSITITDETDVKAKICPEPGRNPQKLDSRKPKRFDAAEIIQNSGLTFNDIEIEMVSSPKKAIVLKPKPHLLERISQRQSSSYSKTKAPQDQNGELSLETSTSYARLGWVMESADLNNDGLDDLIIGAPGHGQPGFAQYGRVYVSLGSDSYPTSNLTLDIQADIVLSGSSESARFGSSLALVDLNRDGVKDLAVGSPSDGAEDLTYFGQISIFYGKKDKIFGTTPDVILKGVDTYENLGWVLTSGDLDSDGFDDLIAGSPYSPSGGQQRGAVNIFFSSSFSTTISKIQKNKKQDIEVRGSSIELLRTELLETSTTLVGDVDYSWFGFSLTVYQNYLFVGAPTFRICANSDCSYSEIDKQSVGRIYVYQLSRSSTTFLFSVTDTKEWNKFGSDISIGFPFDAKQSRPILAVSAPTADVTGFKDGASEVWDQAGKVYLIDLISLLPTETDYIQNNNEKEKNPILSQDLSIDQVSVLSIFEGDRRYDRFGSCLGFGRFNSDTYDDLFISSPMRTANTSELVPDVQQGGLYVFNGGENFQTGNVTQQCPSSSSVIPCPAQVSSFYVEPLQSQTLFSYHVHPLNFFSNLDNDQSILHELAVSSLYYSGPDNEPRISGRVEILRVESV